MSPFLPKAVAVPVPQQGRRIFLGAQVIAGIIRLAFLHTFFAGEKHSEPQWGFGTTHIPSENPTVVCLRRDLDQYQRSSLHQIPSNAHYSPIFSSSVGQNSIFLVIFGPFHIADEFFGNNFFAVLAVAFVLHPRRFLSE